MSGPIEDHVKQNENGSRIYTTEMNGQRVEFPSVTTVISAASSKPWLVPWGAKLAAEFAVDQWETVTTVIANAGRDAAVDLIKSTSARRRADAAERGSAIHDLVEVLVKGGAMPTVPEEFQPFVDAFVQFWMDFNPEPLMTETTVSTDPANTGRDQYAGTADSIMRIRIGGAIITALIDVKTGERVEPNAAAQLAGYRRADLVWLPLGEFARMPKIDATFVLHLRPEGYRLIPVVSDARAFAAFLRMLHLWHWHDRNDGRVLGLPVMPPKEDGTPQDRPIEHVCPPGLSKLLVEAGLPTCEAVADATVAQLLKIKGIGPGKVEGIRKAIAEAGLKLGAEQ